MPEGEHLRALVSEEAFALLRTDAAEETWFIIRGDQDAAGAARVLAALDAEPGGSEIGALFLEETELLDGSATAQMVDAVRLLLERFKRVRLIRSPQVLAHSIYRVGMLAGDTRLELVEPREEEGVAG